MEVKDKKKKKEALVKDKITKTSKRKLPTNFSQLDKKKFGGWTSIKKGPYNKGKKRNFFLKDWEDYESPIR